MKNKYWLTVLLFVVTIKVYGQEIRVNNSFVILVNNNLVTSVGGLKLVLSDSTGKKDAIDGGYYPGVLYVSNIEKKNLLYADSVKKLTLKFDYYENSRNKQITHNYSIEIDRKWFKQSLIILRIFDLDKKRGTYKYSFEVPGYSFGEIKNN